jgi:hypothetical protein
MSNTKIMMAALALTLATTGAAMAKPRTPRAGFEANAQAVGSELQTIGPSLAKNAEHRMDALRQCSNEVAPLKDYTWGDEQTDRYRACMAEHGQPE